MHPKKILLIRFSSIGDIVLTSPVIRCLKNQTGAELHYLTKVSYGSLIASNPYLDRVHLLDHNSKELVDQLKNESFDLIIDLHKNLRSKKIIRVLGVKSISFDKLNVRKYAFTRLKVDVLPARHLVDRYFDSLKSIDVSNDQLGLDYFIPEDQQFNFHHYGIKKGEYHVFAIGGTYATKRLGNKKSIELVDKLDGPCVLIGGPTDSDNGLLIAQGVKKNKVINLCGELDLDQSAVLIKEAKHIICHDSGMMHVASALRKRISVIWGNTHPKLGMYPYGIDNYFQHQVKLKCRPCSKLGYDSCPKKHFNCMQLQNVEEIVKNCNSADQSQ